MKKTLLFSCLLLAASMLVAQTSRTISLDRTHAKRQVVNADQVFAPNSYNYYFSARVSDDGFERKSFTYDQATGRINCVIDSIGNEKVRDSIYYDANNNVVRVSGHQYLNGIWKNVYIVDYEYDADNNMTHRKNYNSLGTETFTQGGVYDYNYQNGHIVSHVGYMGDYQFLFETCGYLYDAQNRLSVELYCQGFETVDSSMKITYEYGANGMVSYKRTYFYNGYGWDLNETEEFFYDAAGNCIEHNVRGSAGSYHDRRFYFYDNNVAASDVAMPYYIPELGLPEGFNDANMRTNEHWYSLDADQVLQHICNYMYIYSTNLSVEEMQQANMMVYPNPVQNVLSVKVDENAVMASIYDFQGRAVQTTTCMSGVNYVDMSDLSAGVYFLKVTFADGKTAVQKIVKQ